MLINSKAFLRLNTSMMINSTVFLDFSSESISMIVWILRMNVHGLSVESLIDPVPRFIVQLFLR